MTTTPTPARPPIFAGRDIGIAYFAISGVREMLLADVGITFEDSLLLTALVDHGGAAPRAELVDVLVGGLKITTAAASVAVDHLIAHGLAGEEGDTVVPTPAGSEAHDRFNDRIAASAPKLYGGIPDEDLAVAKRVLTTVTERANRELELNA